MCSSRGKERKAFSYYWYWKEDGKKKKEKVVEMRFPDGKMTYAILLDRKRKKSRE